MRRKRRDAATERFLQINAQNRQPGYDIPLESERNYSVSQGNINTLAVNPCFRSKYSSSIGDQSQRANFSLSTFIVIFLYFLYINDFIGGLAECNSIEKSTKFFHRFPDFLSELIFLCAICPVEFTCWIKTTYPVKLISALVAEITTTWGRRLPLSSTSIMSIHLAFLTFILDLVFCGVCQAMLNDFQRQIISQTQ